MADTTKEFAVYAISADGVRDIVDVEGFNIKGDLTDSDMERIAVLVFGIASDDIEMAIESAVYQILGNRIVDREPPNA